MSIEQYIKSSQSTLGNYFLSEHGKFRIPLNQRPWSWKASDLEGFWNDLLIVSDRYYHVTGTDQNKWQKKTGAEPAPYFIGAIVAMKQGDELELVDGQQRITAVTMIVAAFLEELFEIQANYTGSRRGATAIQFAVRQATTWLETPDENPKLNVDEQFQDLFYAYISKPVTKELKAQALEALDLDFASMPYHKKLVNCYDSIRSTISVFLREIAETNRIKAINALLDVLGNSFVCIYATVNEETFALEVFKSLNAKGIPLTQADNIKNELFVHSQKADHINIRQHWIYLSQNVPKGLIENFLRLRHISLIGPCKSKELYKTLLEKEIQTPEIKMLKLIKEWRKDSEWAARLTLNKSYSSYNAQIKYLLDALFEKLKISYGLIFLLVAAKKFLPDNKNDFEKAARLTLNYCFRFLTICDKDTPELEANLGNVARELHNGNMTLYDVARELRLSSPDNVFKMEFEVKSIRTTDVRYYIFHEIEKYLGGYGRVPAAGINQSIEHIMPKTFSKAKSRNGEWSWAKDSLDLHKQFLNRLGNMCLIEKDINGHVESYDFSAKQGGGYPGSASQRKGERRKHYGDSEMHLVKDLADAAKYSEWNFDKINERQKVLAETAIKIWTLKIDEF